VADEEHVHGVKAYRKGSRDPECVAANYRQQRAWREQKRSKPVPSHVHGTLNGYQIYGCTCPKCSAAQKRARDRRNAGKRRLRELAKRGLPRTYEGPLT
jgi:hypothetical protein